MAANPEGYLLGPKALEQIRNTVHAELARVRVATPMRGRWQRSGGRSACTAQDDWQDITVLGQPTGGSFTWALTINATSANISIAYNDSAARIQSAIVARHSQVSSGDVTCSGGPLPNSTVRVKFEGNLANQPIDLALANFSALTGGSGMAVITSKAQLGATG